MGKQYGILTYQGSGAERKILADPEISSLFDVLNVTQDTDLCSDILSVFLGFSEETGIGFMDYAYGNDTAALRQEEPKLPVFGIKGTLPGSPSSRYAHLCVCDENELYGTGFIEHVFGTSFLNAKEIFTSGEMELRDRVEAAPRRVTDFTIAQEDQEDVCRIVESLWETQEINMTSRLVVVTGDDDERALRLIRGVCMMLPHRLRLKMGFLTNVKQEDLAQIAKGLPIYLMTVHYEDQIQPDEIKGMKIKVLDLTDEGLVLETDRMNLLRQTAANMDRIFCSCFGLAEEDVLERYGVENASFRYYREILERTFDPQLYWWNRTDIDSIEQLHQLYTKQKKLMEDENTEEQALSVFYSQMLPSAGFASKTLEILENEEYPRREELLAFLREELKAAPQIDAALDMIRSLKERASVHEREALTRQEQNLTDTFSSQMEQEQIVQNDTIASWQKKLQECSETAQRQLDESQARTTELETDLEEQKASVSSLSQQVQEKDALIAKLSERTREDQERIEDLEGRLREGGILEIEQVQEEARTREQALIREKEDLQLQAQEQLKEASDQVQALSKGKKRSTALAVVLALLAAGGIGGTVYGLSSAHSQTAKVAALESENTAALEAQGELSEENARISDDLKTVQKEKEELQSEIQALQAELEKRGSTQTEEAQEPESETAEAEEEETEAAGPMVTFTNGEEVQILVDGQPLKLY